MDPARIKVLYVDDEEGNLTAFRATFRREFEVHIASDAATALELLAKEHMHVVISDQRMPRITGSEFLAQVKMRWPRTVRFLLTGFSDIEAVIDAVNDGGIHAYVTKPWDPTDLKLRIEQAYEVHALRDDRERLLSRYRQVFEDSGDPIVIFDHSGHILEANAAAQKLVGADRSSLITSKLDRFIQDPGRWVHALAGKRKGSSFTGLDLSLTTFDGNTVDCLMTVTYLGRNPDDQVLYQAVIKDITDRRQEEVQLKKLNADLDKRVNVRTKQLMEALDDLGAFSYSVAHDLRSPLKNIKALSEHLGSLAALRGDEEERDLSSRIHKGTARLINLVDDLLRFARTDTHEMRNEPNDLRQVVDECVHDMGGDHGNVEFVLPEAGVNIIPADRAMLKVALNNLLTNALKFSRTRAVPRVEIGHRIDEGNHMVWVKDNGVGFEESKSEQVFGVFKRLHRNDQFEGTGIGLAIVQRIMQKHSGSCWAESALDQGATFFLRFPAQITEQRFRMVG
ncbi:MAG TPA: ATP-binding protein [Flavobacteriales bacterium]